MKRLLAILMCTASLLCGCGKAAEILSEKETLSFSEQSTIYSDADFIESETESGAVLQIEGKVIVIDAGHCIVKSNRKEAIAPNTSETKAAFVSGTRGKNQTEEELNLILALKLQKSLTALGAEVCMTRTEHESDMSNIDRAEFANKLNADISVKIHADGSEDSSVHGVSVLVPGDKYIADNALIEESRKAGEYVLEEFVGATGALNRGISVRNDMTGFNWSKVPTILVEVGFMTNPEEDELMETSEYQDKMISGIVNGIKKYFEEK